MKNRIKKPEVAQLTPTSEDPDVIVCTECRNSWFELVEVKQFRANYSVVLGQRPPTKQDAGFYLYKCIHCGELYEPEILAGGRDAYTRAYEDFLNQMEKPLPKSVEVKSQVKGLDGEDL